MADLRIVDAPEIPTNSITGQEKLPTGGSGNYSITLDSVADYTKTKKDLADNTSVDGKVNGVRQELESHIEDLLNPHQVTKDQIGLGNVDNTADADKPVSNSTQASIISAVAPKADKSYVDNQLTLKANKSDVYTKVETYTKQESSDLVSSNISIALNPVNSSLDLAKRGIANRYDPLLTYNSGERVVLTNGDIVKSTIDGNANNPNTDMTGWVKTNSTNQIFQSNGLSQESRNSQNPTILDFFTKLELANYLSNPSMDCTAIIRRAFATGVKKLNCLDLQMNITISSTVDDPLAIFEDGDIEIFGNGAAFIDNTVYATTVASFNPLFILNGDVSSFKSNVAHIGLQIPDMATQIGYRGATYVYSKRANKNIHLYARLENTRYGVLAGSYADPSLGGAKHLRFDLDCKNVGYPIATYLADDIEGEIRGDGFHRVHYIAGCNHARIKTQTKNYYIAPIAHLYSDAMTSVGVSKGCTDCETEAIDTGSTQYVSNGYLLGISPSRVDPDTVYDSVKLTGSLVGKTGQCEKLGLATIVSSVRTVQPSYPANWESSIYLNNITVNGQINRRSQTTAEHDFSDVYFSCLDNVSISGEDHFPTIRNLSVNVDYFAGSGTKPRGFWWFLNGLQDKANVRLYAPNSGQNVIRSNTTSLIKFHDSNIVGVDLNTSSSFNSKMEFIDSFISDAAQLPTVNKRFVNTPIAGVYPSGTQITTTSNTLTLSGASVSWANALPNNALILSVSFVVVENITGSTGLFVGVTGTPSKYFSSTIVTAGSGLSNANLQVGSIPHNQVGTGNILVTARDSGGGTSATFTGGKVKIVLNYILFPVPTI